MTEVEVLAQAMYAERAAERGPHWNQLGEVTKSVWREIASAQLFGDLA